MVDAFNVSDAKARFSELVDRAADGEEVTITKRGRPIAKIVAVDRAKPPLDVEALRALTSKMTMYQDPDGLSFVERMRREDRL
jgi:prevent-host-death family protein